MDAEGEKDELHGVVEDWQTEKEKLSKELDSKQVHNCFILVIMTVNNKEHPYKFSAISHHLFVIILAT